MKSTFLEHWYFEVGRGLSASESNSILLQVSFFLAKRLFPIDENMMLIVKTIIETRRKSPRQKPIRRCLPKFPKINHC